MLSNSPHKRKHCRCLVWGLNLTCCAVGARGSSEREGGGKWAPTDGWESDQPGGYQGSGKRQVQPTAQRWEDPTASDFRLAHPKTMDVKHPCKLNWLNCPWVSVWLWMVVVVLFLFFLCVLGELCLSLKSQLGIGSTATLMRASAIENGWMDGGHWRNSRSILSYSEP